MSVDDMFDLVSTEQAFAPLLLLHCLCFSRGITLQVSAEATRLLQFFFLGDPGVSAFTSTCRESRNFVLAQLSMAVNIDASWQRLAVRRFEAFHAHKHINSVASKHHCSFRRLWATHTPMLLAGHPWPWVQSLQSPE